jgi:hypothetical protein
MSLSPMLRALGLVVLLLAPALHAERDAMLRVSIEPGRDLWYASPVELRLLLDGLEPESLQHVDPSSFRLSLNGIDVTGLLLSEAARQGGVRFARGGRALELRCALPLPQGWHELGAEYRTIYGGGPRFAQRFYVYDENDIRKGLGLAPLPPRAQPMQPLNVTVPSLPSQAAPVFLSPSDKLFVKSGKSDLEVRWMRGGRRHEARRAQDPIGPAGCDRAVRREPGEGAVAGCSAQQRQTHARRAGSRTPMGDSGSRARPSSSSIRARATRGCMPRQISRTRWRTRTTSSRTTAPAAERLLPITVSMSGAPRARVCWHAPAATSRTSIGMGSSRTTSRSRSPTRMASAGSITTWTIRRSRRASATSLRLGASSRRGPTSGPTCTGRCPRMGHASITSTSTSSLPMDVL